MRRLRPRIPVVLLLLLGGSASASATLRSASVPPEEPVPVLLVPGWGDRGADMEPLRRRLVNQGWPESWVGSVSFRNPVGSNAHHADEIDAAVQRMLTLTGVQQLDVVAHSMGGLAVRFYLRQGHTRQAVRRTVFLGTPHRGTAVAFLAWGSGGREMILGSDFLAKLNDGPPVPEGVEALSIRTPVDLRVIPASSAILFGEGVRNVEICCPSHNALVDDDETFGEVFRFLTGGGANRTLSGLDPRPAFR